MHLAPLEISSRLGNGSNYLNTHLVGTLVMLPPSGQQAEVDWHTFQSARNTSLFSLNGQLPPAWLWDDSSPYTATLGDAMKSFTTAAAVYDQLLMWADPHENVTEHEPEERLLPPPFERFSAIVRTRSWFIDTHDGATYDHGRYLLQMKRLRNKVSERMSLFSHTTNLILARIRWSNAHNK